MVIIALLFKTQSNNCVMLTKKSEQFLDNSYMNLLENTF